MSIFSERLQALRKEKNLSQIELAESLNISRQTLSKWENGNIMPDATNLVALAKYFNVSVDYLLGISESSSSPKNDIGNWKYHILLVISLFGFFILMLLSSYHPCIVWIDEITYTGFFGYVLTFNLQWLVILLSIGLIFSLWNLILKKKLIKRIKDFI